MQLIAVRFHPAEHLTGEEDALLNPSTPPRKPAAAEPEHERQYTSKRRRDLDRHQARKLKYATSR